MFDNLRAQADASPSYSDESETDAVPDLEIAPTRKSPSGHFLGMTAPQRLLIAILLVGAVCVLGSLCLLITGRIGAL